MKVFILSRQMAEAIGRFPSTMLVISITSPGQDDARIVGENVFRFQLHDIDTELYLEDRNMILLPLSEDIAKNIAKVVVGHRHLHALVVHCEAGISRSPGVALAVASYLTTTPPLAQLEKLFPCHNRHVRRLVETAIRELMEKGSN